MRIPLTPITPSHGHLSVRSSQTEQELSKAKSVLGGTDELEALKKQVEARLLIVAGTTEPIVQVAR